MRFHWLQDLSGTCRPFELFLEVAALGSSELLNYENISNDVGVCRSAVISWFQILYDTLIAFEVPAYTKTKKRKALKEEWLFFRYILVCNEDYETTEDGIEIVPWRQFLDDL